MSDSSDKNSNYLLVCTLCGKQYPTGTVRCADDGVELQKAVNLLGTVFLGKYNVESILGQGGMSIVYKVRHLDMEKVMALKVLNGELSNDKVAIERFRREARAAASLSHQNVVVVHDFGSTKTQPAQAYLIMDCLEGISLAEMVEQEGAIPVARAVEIFKQALDGLEHAHKKGIIHRDIKPSNLVIIKDEDGSDLVKLVDFGIAKATPTALEGKRQQLTQTGEVFGSPLYMSPEQCNGRSVDARSDIYSFGCLMYETLAGIPPLVGDTYIKTVVKHLQEEPRPFSETAPGAGIPGALEAVVMKCLAKEPDNRYATVSELRQSLLDAALAGGVKGYVPGAVPAVPKNSALERTFERMALAATGGLMKQTGRLTAKKLVIPGVTAAALIGLAAWACLVPTGAPGDRVSILNRFLWEKNLEMAHEAAARGNNSEANKFYGKAVAIAAAFDDDSFRLYKALDQQLKFAQTSGNSAEEERIRKEMMSVVTTKLRNESKSLYTRLSELEYPAASDNDRKRQREAVKALDDAVKDSSLRLHGRDLHAEEQRLLEHAINVHAANGIGQSPFVADFKTQLAKCYAEQQHFDKVRPLLIEAVSIRELPKEKTAQDYKLLARAKFALGSFDRDQSNFEDSATELKQAIEIAEKTPDAQNLLLESLKAYADLIRQSELTGKPIARTDDVKVLNSRIAKLEARVCSKDQSLPDEEQP